MLRLKHPLGRVYNVDLDDVFKVKTALQGLGFYKAPDFGLTRYPDEQMFDAVERFQERHGLTKDGIMKPNGPTHRVLMAQMVGPGGEGRTDEDPERDPPKDSGGGFELPGPARDQLLDGNAEYWDKKSKIKLETRPPRTPAKPGGGGGAPWRRRIKQPWDLIQYDWDLLD